MKSISVIELREKINNREEIILIDVREPWEHEVFNIGGSLIPLNTLQKNIGDLHHHKSVIFYCQKGIRSQVAIQRLQQKYGYTNLVNLTGGIDAWQRHLSQEM